MDFLIAVGVTLGGFTLPIIVYGGYGDALSRMLAKTVPLLFMVVMETH